MAELELTTHGKDDDRRLRALMVSYQSGDLAAFDELYVRLAPTIRRVLQRQGCDRDRLKDVTQDVFLQMHRARHTYDSAYPVLPWVMAITRHVWLMHRRTARRHPQPTETIDRAEPTTRADADAYAVKADVQTALGALTPGRRRPLIWHHVWGLSFREIASRLGIREDAAKLRSSRGMADLRRLLAGRKTLRNTDVDG